MAAAVCGREKELSSHGHRGEVGCGGGEALPAPSAGRARQHPRRLAPAAAARSRRGPVSRPRSRGELLRDWRWRAPSSAVQRGADDGLDGQPLPDARAADLEARVALHGDGGRGDHRASER